MYSFSIVKPHINFIGKNTDATDNRDLILYGPKPNQILKFKNEIVKYIYFWENNNCVFILTKKGKHDLISIDDKHFSVYDLNDTLHESVIK